MKILSKLDNTGMIEEVADKRYVSDTEKANWNNKWDYNESTIKAVKVSNAGHADSADSASKLGLFEAEYYATMPYVQDVHDSLQNSLDNKVNNSRVLTDVPANAEFTDTVTTINGKTGAISKGDIVALGIPSSDTNTTYTEITTTEIDAGTSSTRRTISGRRVQYIVDKAVSSVSGFAPTSHTHSASDITSGTLSYLRIPRGTTSTTVAIGNHTHSNYASTSHTHTSFSGLTLSNPLVCSNLTASTHAMNLKPNNGNGGHTYSYGSFSPNEAGKWQLGTTSYRWNALYISTGGINEGSDIRQKDNIEDIPYDLLKYFADEVKPKMFEVNGKTHFGYIAQDVERALYKYALDKVGFENAQEYVDEFNLLGKGESYLSLVYSQIAVVKEAEMQDRIDKLELQIEELKSLID